MSHPGQALLAHIEGTERLLRDVAALVGGAETMMQEAAWENAAADSTAWAYGAFSLARAASWMPSEVFRFFAHEKSTTLLPYMSVLLRNNGGEYSQFDEPLVTAGVFVYEKLPKVDGKIFWHSRWHAYRTDRTDDGSWFRSAVTELKQADVKKFKYEWSEVHTMGVPLVGIGSESDLRDRVVNPLLAKIAAL